MNFILQRANRVVYTAVVLCIFFSIHSCKEQHPKVKEIKNLFGLEVIIDKDYQSSSGRFSYRKVNDTKRISNYLDILIQEYKKYPPAFFEKININKIIICDSMFVLGRRRSAYPYAQNKTLILAIDFFEERLPYMIHVMHHELHHCTEFSLYGSMYYRSDEWNCLNSANFMYGSGGAIQYKEGSTKKNWYKLTHFKEGFVNEYSSLGQEEDRAELMAILMNKPRRDTLIDYCKTDEYLKKKVHYLINEMNTMMGSSGHHWETILSEFDEN